jgi:hypothetical protein
MNYPYEIIRVSVTSCVSPTIVTSLFGELRGAIAFGKLTGCDRYLGVEGSAIAVWGVKGSAIAIWVVKGSAIAVWGVKGSAIAV